MTNHRHQAERLADQANHFSYGDGADPTTGAALATEGLVHAVLAMTDQLSQLVATLTPTATTPADDLRARLIALLPTEPMPQRGLPNDLAEAQGYYGAFEAVAEVLGVTLPVATKGSSV